MATLIRMAARRARTGLIHFERHELTQLLTLYAALVAGGEWRDYAIDLEPDRAVFSIFRHTQERPVFTITKSASGRYDDGWTVTAGGRELARSASLTDILATLERKPRLAPS